MNAQQPPPSTSSSIFQQWYNLATTGFLLDKMMCACGTQMPVDEEEIDQPWEAVSTYEEKQLRLQKTNSSDKSNPPPHKWMASYAEQDFTSDGNSILATCGGVRRNCCADVEKRDLAEDFAIQRDNSMLEKGRDPEEDVALNPPISPAATYSTVSLTHSLFEDTDTDDEDDDEEDEVLSTVTTEAVTNCFRQPPAVGAMNRLRSRSDDEHGDGGAYRVLLRMKPQNYLEDSECGTHDRSIYQGGIIFQPPTTELNKKGPTPMFPSLP